MSVLAFAGAELGSAAELITPSGITADSAIVRSGKYSYRVAAGGGGYLAIADHSTPIYFRGYLRYPAGLATNTNVLMFRSSGGITQVTLRLVPSGGVCTLRVAGSATLNGGSGIRPDVWVRIEMLVWQAGSQVEVRLNGRNELGAGGYAIASPIGQISLANNSTGNIWWDDLHVTEDGYPGAGHVMVRQGRVGSTPAYDQFVKTGGGIIDIWSDTPVNAATFASDGGTTTTQTMRIEAVNQYARMVKYGPSRLNGGDTILGAQILVMAKRGSGTPDHYISGVRDGLLVNFPMATTTTDALYSSGIFSITRGQLNTGQIGAARGAGTAALTVEDVWVMISLATNRALGDSAHFTGVESGSLLEFWSFSGTVAVDTTNVRTGAYSAKLTGPNARISVQGGNAEGGLDMPELYQRVYLMLPVLPTSAVTVMANKTSLGWDCEVQITNTGAANLVIGGVTRGTIAAVIKAGQWHRVELYAKSDVVSSGAAEMRVDDLSVRYEPGMAGNVTYAMCEATVEVRQEALVMYTDDFWVSTEDWGGPGRVIGRQGIAGTPTYNAWPVRVGGTEAWQVWSQTPSNAASYAEPNAIAQAQTMKVAPVSSAGPGGHFIGPTGMPRYARVFAKANLVSGSGGPYVLRALSTLQPTILYDTDMALYTTGSLPQFSRLFTGSVVRLDTMEIGAVQEQGAPFIRVEDLWMMVEYNELTPPVETIPDTPRPIALVEVDLP